MAELLKGMHTQARLETRDGDFVTYVQVPIMNPPADLLGWGNRVFVMTQNAEELPDGEIAPIYREGLPWAVFDLTAYGEPFARG